MALNRVDEIRELDDPHERVRMAHTELEHTNEVAEQLIVIRRNAIEECIANGVTAVKLADELGITRSRISQLRTAGAKPERTFLGSGRLTIAIGSKPEQGRQDEAAKFMVSKEAFTAFEAIAETARTLGLDAVSETVPPPGMVDLNRPNLVVLCSPRLLPFVQQVLAADNHLGFQQDDQGWYLVDKTEDKIYRSPRDSDEARDYGYVGRLPRPDGKGTFLYIAGIHAEGTLGSAQWLVANLPDLYRNFKAKRFSLLTATEFDRESGSIVDVQTLTKTFGQE